MFVRKEGARQFFKFLIVGGVNTLFGYSCYAAFYLFGLSPWLALLLASFLAVIFNFFTFSRVVFKNYGTGNFIRYIIVFFILYFINKGLLEMIIVSGGNPLYIQAFLAPVMACLSFVLMKAYVFRTRNFQRIKKTG